MSDHYWMEELFKERTKASESRQLASDLGWELKRAQHQMEMLKRDKENSERACTVLFCGILVIVVLVVLILRSCGAIEKDYRDQIKALQTQLADVQGQLDPVTPQEAKK